jgi:uncharacterized membrane protein
MSRNRAGRSALVGVVAGVSSIAVVILVGTIGLAFHLGAAVTAIAVGVILLAFFGWFFVRQIRVGRAMRATRPDD